MLKTQPYILFLLLYVKLKSWGSTNANIALVNAIKMCHTKLNEHWAVVDKTNCSSSITLKYVLMKWMSLSCIAIPLPIHSCDFLDMVIWNFSYLLIVVAVQFLSSRVITISDCANIWEDFIAQNCCPTFYNITCFAFDR